MRIIYKFFIIATITLSLHAETVTGRLSCITASNNNVNTVVVFLNGITNTLEDAENSRLLLESKLSDTCNGVDCIVQKFYNKTDGFFDDRDELDFVGGLERDSANVAFRKLIIQMKIGYIRYKSLLKDKVNIDDYKEADDKVWAELTRLYNKAKDSSTDSEVEFSKAGTNITEWLIDSLLNSENIPSPYNSIFITSMKNKQAIYDIKYKHYYSSTLTEYYLSDREFYKSDNNADKAVTRTVESLVSYLEEHMLSGKKIVVVAHSQGNHMIELAYGVLKEKWGTTAVQAIQVVGVASVASTTPSNTYLTWDDDHTVLNIYDKDTDGDPLVSNFTTTDNSEAGDIINDHNFIEVYMNHNLKGRYQPNGRGNLSNVQTYLEDTQEYPVDDWIIGLIKGSIEASTPYTSEISTSGFINATLRWEEHDDMDLWINENNENSVSYENMTGIYDSTLDRDDTDGEGPEHYTSNISCENVHNKIWKFGIHQYPSGNNSAIAHFSIRIGNLSPISKSYSLSSWPSDKQWIGTITFGDMYQYSQVPYTITIEDTISSE
ncbi:MAG: hypothetical protein U9N59_05680 [Campylobacterota bacterium]|nr:hypothetical protein [Campylobacterota bacterium]